MDASVHSHALYQNFETIDWVRDLIRDQKRQKQLKDEASNGETRQWEGYFNSLFEASQTWILVFVVGVTIGLVASFIAIVAAWLVDIRQGYCRTEWYLSRSICCTGFDKESCTHWSDWSETLFRVRGVTLIDWLLYVFFSAAWAAAAAVLVVMLGPQAAGSGTAEVKTVLGGFIIKGFLSLQTFVIKAVSLPLTVASGLAVGKEGPMIHVACSVGNLFPRFFPKYWKNEARKREILSAAAASGVAVAFGAPIGGVVFSLEELSSFFPAKTMLRSFFCALVSVVTLQIIDPFRGKRVLFAVSYSRNWHLFEAPFFLLLGLFGGLSGAFFMTVNKRVRAFRKTLWTSSKPIVEVIIIALATALLCYLNGFTRVDSSELLEFLFKECSESGFNGLCENEHVVRNIMSLTFALILRLSLTIVTMGVQVPSGIFIPSMVWGALFGRIVGILVQSWQLSRPNLGLFIECHPDQICVTPGMYALLGAIGALGGVTKMTVSLTVIMFELTGTLSYIIPCMMTLMVAKLSGDYFWKGGMTDAQIHEKNYPFLDGTEDVIVGSPAYELMTSMDNLTTLTITGMTVGQLQQILAQTEYKGFPIVRDMDTCLFRGYITRAEIHRAIDLGFENQSISKESGVVFTDRENRGDAILDLSPFIDETPFTVHPNVQIELVMDMFKKLGPRFIIVTDKDRLRGIITKKDLLRALHENEEQSGTPTTVGGSLFYRPILGLQNWVTRRQGSGVRLFNLRNSSSHPAQERQQLQRYSEDSDF